MTPPTPGQIAYEAYRAAYKDCFIWTLPWDQLQPHFRPVWEATAQAVHARLVAMEPPQAPTIPTCRWCGQPVAAHPQEGEPWRCRLSDGPRLPREDAP